MCRATTPRLGGSLPAHCTPHLHTLLVLPAHKHGACLHTHAFCQSLRSTAKVQVAKNALPHALLHRHARHSCHTCHGSRCSPKAGPHQSLQIRRDYTVAAARPPRRRASAAVTALPMPAQPHDAAQSSCASSMPCSMLQHMHHFNATAQADCMINRYQSVHTHETSGSERCMLRYR